MEIHIHIENVYITEGKQITPKVLTVRKEIKNIIAPLNPFPEEPKQVSSPQLAVGKKKKLKDNPGGKTKQCAECGKEFVYEYNRQMFCSAECHRISDDNKKKDYKNKYKSTVIKTTAPCTEAKSKNFKAPADEFHADYYMSITDPAKRANALFNKRFVLKKTGKLTNLINAEIQSMLDLCKELKKKSKRNR